MNKNTKGILFTTAIITLLLCFAAAIIWSVENSENDITTSRSPDGEYTLEISEIGEPIFPYGEARCRAVLKHGGDTVERISFSVKNDGAAAGKENFTVVWGENIVTLTVTGSEQEPESFELALD